ncbi:MAG: ABC transporter permease [Candidatus Acidiferrales bacterium]
METLWQDIRYGARQLARSPGFTAVAVLTLALGIGSTTLVFSLANGLLVRPLPYAEPQRLVAVEEFDPLRPAASFGVAFPNYLDFRARTRLLGDVAVFTEGLATIRGEGEAERVRAASVTDGIFPLLGVQPILGRVISKQEDSPDGPRAVVLGQDLWQRRYGGNPSILGQTVQIGTQPYTVVGVMPSSFRFPERAELWVPLQLSPERSTRTDHYLEGIARLKPGATVELATEELRALMEQLNQENPLTDNGFTARAVPIRQYVAAEYRLAVITLLGGVSFLLLIACSNLTNLLLFKASARVREMAVRTAVGASRTRLIRQLVTESLLLGMLGCAGGVLLAQSGIPLLLVLIPVELPRWMSFEIDGLVLGFAAAVSVLTSVVFGLVPALTVSRVNLSGALKEGSRSGTVGSRRRLLRDALVVGEIALSLTLLVGAGLLIRSFIALSHQPLGFQPENVLTMQIAAPETRYPRGPQRRALLQELRNEVSGVPGIRSIAFASGVPISDRWGRSLTVEGHPLLALKDAPMINHTVVTPGYFRTLEIPLLEGRDFVESDWDNPLVTIVDETLAKRYWPNETAIGKRIRFGPPEDNEPWHTVIGVAANTRNQFLNRPERWSVYIPYSALVSPGAVLVARTGPDPQRLAQAVRRRIVDYDRDIAVSRILSLEQVVTQAAWRERFFAVLLAFFSALALVLACVGLYGVMAYAVSLRRHEIGVRMALGASTRHIGAMVLGQGMRLTSVGLVLGMVAALGLARLLSAQLYQVSPNDLQTYLAVAVILAVAALLAVYIPARRAARVDPMVALRYE